jgi:acyl-CoA thioesterase
MTDLERARAVFGKDNFAAETGCVIEAVEPGYARCSLALETRHRNALGAPMGGAIFTLADFSFAVASNFDRDVYVSTSADVHFLSSAKGSILRAEAREIRCGRRTCLFGVTITDELETQVAYVTVSGMLVQTRRRKEG